MATQQDTGYIGLEGEAFYVSGSNTSEPIESEPQLSPEELEKQREAWRTELHRTEEEIQTLRQVLHSKIRSAQKLKQQLGITPLNEVKRDLQDGLAAIKATNTYQKTSAAVKLAKDKTSTTLSTAGSKVSQKFTSVRNSNAFKSVEGRLGSAYQSVKNKLTMSGSGDVNDSAPTAIGDEKPSAGAAATAEAVNLSST